MFITKIQKQLETPPNTPAMSTSFTLCVDVVCRVGVSVWRPYVSTWTSVATYVWKVGSACWLGVENNRLQFSKLASKVYCVAPIQ